MDRRSERSKRAIREAFQALLTEKGYAQMTVGEVIKRADVGRTTFYAHFPCKEALLDDLVESVCLHVAAPVGPEASHDFSGDDGLEATVEHALRHLRERESGVRALVMGSCSTEFARALRRVLSANVHRFTPDEPTGAASSLSPAFLERHLVGSFVEMVLWWAERGFSDDPNDLARQYATCAKALFAS